MANPDRIGEPTGEPTGKGENKPEEVVETPETGPEGTAEQKKEQLFKHGQQVRVEGDSGELEDGWFVAGFTPEGVVVVDKEYEENGEKKTKSKLIHVEQLEFWQKQSTEAGEEEKRVEFELPKDVDRVRQLALKLDEYNERIAAKNLVSSLDVLDIIDSLFKKTILRRSIEKGKITSEDKESLEKELREKIKNLLRGKLRLESETEKRAVERTISKNFVNSFEVIQSYCEGTQEKNVFGGTGLPEIEK